MTEEVLGLPERTRAVADALEALGATGRPSMLDSSARTAAEAAASLGVPVGAIANSLVFIADGAPILVMTSGAHRVDTDALATRLGKSSIARATPDEVRAATGQVIGGVSPVGHPAPIETVVDEHLAEYPELWAAAGDARAVFPTTFDELVRITNGTIAKVD